MFPVTVFHTDLRDDRRPAEKAAATVAQIVNADDPGDILVFMPGMGEIQQTLNELRAIRTDERLACLPLYGELPIEQQDLAFARSSFRVC